MTLNFNFHVFLIVPIIILLFNGSNKHTIIVIIIIIIIIIKWLYDSTCLKLDGLSGNEASSRLVDLGPECLYIFYRE